MQKTRRLWFGQFMLRFLHQSTVYMRTNMHIEWTMRAQGHLWERIKSKHTTLWLVVNFVLKVKAIQYYSMR